MQWEDTQVQVLEEQVSFGDGTPQSGLQIPRDATETPARVAAEIKKHILDLGGPQ